MVEHLTMPKISLEQWRRRIRYDDARQRKGVPPTKHISVRHASETYMRYHESRLRALYGGRWVAVLADPKNYTRWNSAIVEVANEIGQSNGIELHRRILKQYGKALTHRGFVFKFI